MKYIDDLTVAESIQMKNQLQKIAVEDRVQPDTFHERTGHVLQHEKSKVFLMIKRIEEYARQNKMKLNYKKTKLMLFNPGTARDFMPRFEFNNEEIEVVEEYKLLGLIMRNDLSWSSNTNFMITRANKKLWCLKRLKRLGANTKDLLDVYCKQIRSILEFASPVWHPSLTSKDRGKVERVQKSALCIILGRNFKSYNRALKSLRTDSLFTRREKLCRKFALKSQKHPRFTKWFKPQTKKTTRRKLPKFMEVYSRTKRFQKSSINFLTNILNNV